MTATAASEQKDTEGRPAEATAGSPEAAQSAGAAGTVAAGWLGHELMSRPANASVRTSAAHRAQRTYGNRSVQRMLSNPRPGSISDRVKVRQVAREVQRGTSASDRESDVAGLASREPISSSGDGEPLDEVSRGFMESRLNRDLGDVRIHTDESAGAAADTLNARAFTTGRDIYFARGEYSPRSSDGQRLLAHELVHTVQQQGSAAGLARATATYVSSPADPLEREAFLVSDAMISGAPLPEITPGATELARDVAKQPYDTSSASAAQKDGITAQAWVAKHSANLVGQVGYSLSLADLSITTPFVAWRAGVQRQFMIDLWQPFWAGQGNAWSMLNSVLAPDSLERAVNAGRDCYPWDLGTADWSDPVVGEVYKLVMKRLIESQARVVPVWRSVKNQLALRAEGGEQESNREPTRDEVQPAHPMDVYVIGALAGKLEINFSEYRKAFPDANELHEVRAGLRPVRFEFRPGPGAWNWVKVLSPQNPTAEEVAKAIYGTETSAYRLTAAPPFFGFDRLDELHPENRKRFSIKADASDFGPTVVPGPAEPTPALQVMAGPLGNSAALIQAAKFKASSKATKGTVIDRMRIIVRTLDQIADYVAAPFGFGSGIDREYLIPVRDRVDKRSATLNAGSDADAVQWDAQSTEQLSLVNAALSGLTMAAYQRETFKAWPSVNNVIHYIAGAFSRVAQNSELVDTGRWWLNFANEQLRLFPVTLMDLLLAELRRALLAAREERMGFGIPQPRASRDDVQEMDAREKKLRAALVKVRDVVLQHPEQAKAALEPLFKEIADLQVQVTLVTDLDACDRAWRALYESLSTSGAIRSTWHGGNDLVRKAMGDAQRMSSEWSAIYVEYKYVDKEKAKRHLQEKSKSDEWAGFMESIRQTITDQATYDKWTTFTLMVGIGIVTAGVGTYVEAAAGAAWGATAGFAASTVVEAATFTSLSYGLVTKDPSIAGFAEEFGKNVLTFGALKIISRVYRLGVGVEAAASAPGKAGEILVTFVAFNGPALYEADQDKRKKFGQGLTLSEIGEISLNNVAFLVAMAIGSKLAEPWLAEMHATGELKGDMIRLKSEQAKLSQLVETVKAEKGKNPAVAHKMLEKQAELIDLQEKTLTKLEQLSADPKAAAAAGLTPGEQAKLGAARAEFTDALEQLAQAKVATQLEPVGPSEFLVKGGNNFDEVKRFFDGQKGTTSVELAPDPVTHGRILEVIPTDSAPFQVTERSSGATAEVGRPSQPAVAEGEPAEVLADLTPPDPKSVPETPREPAEPKDSTDAPKPADSPKPGEDKVPGDKTKPGAAKTPVEERLDRARQEIADARGKLEELSRKIGQAQRKVRTLKEQAINSTGEAKANALKDFKTAKKALEKLLDDERHFTSERSKWRTIEGTLEKALNSETYSRPRGYRGGVREKVWENAKDSKGIVRDPLTKQPMNFDEPWVMGHKPKYEFWKHQVSAAERGISREQFLDECNDPEIYRPETHETSESHAGEDKTSAYKGK